MVQCDFPRRVGPAVKQYGRFLLHLEAKYRGSNDRLQPARRYKISLPVMPNSTVAIWLGRVPFSKSDLVSVIAHLHTWLDKNRATMDEGRYQLIQNALRELEEGLDIP